VLDFMELFIKNYREERSAHKKLVTIDELAEGFGKEADSTILRAAQIEGLLFVGGKLFFELSPDGERYEAGMEAFFQRPNGEWVSKRNRTTPQPLDILLLDDRTELRRKKRIEYELTKPE